MRRKPITCDALVIGSGAGGAVAAATLAAAGHEVVVLEEGSRYDTSEIAAASPAENLRRLYRAGGLVPIYGTPNIPFGEGRVVGGTTVVNGGLVWRAPEELLDQWAESSGVGGFDLTRLAPHFDRIERRLGVMEQHHGDGNNDSRVLAEAADRLGLRWNHSRRAVRGCAHANRCVTGCPRGAKQSMALTYLPDARRDGARIAADTRATLLTHDGGIVRSVTAIRPNGEKVMYRPRTVYLSAGPIQSPLLLRRSVIAPHRAGNALAFHVNIRTIALFAQDLRASAGTIFTAQVHHHAQRGVLIMPANLTRGSLAAAAAGHDPATVHRLLDSFDHVGVYTTQVRVEGTATVRALPGGLALIRHRLTAKDHELVRFAVTETARLLFEAGAVELFPSLSSAGPVRSPTEAAEFATHTAPRRWEMVSVHAMASNRMGLPERGGVCDELGRPHGMRNLHVCDASVLPGATGISPQATTMAFAHEIVERSLT